MHGVRMWSSLVIRERVGVRRLVHVRLCKGRERIGLGEDRQREGGRVD